MQHIPENAGYLNRRSSFRLIVLNLIGLLASTFLLISNAQAESSQVRVGLYENPTKIFTMPDGKASGIMVDILEEIAKQECWHIVYVACEWQSCRQQLKLGAISPAEFFPLAEENGMIIPMDEWVLRTAAKQTKAWFDAG